MVQVICLYNIFDAPGATSFSWVSRALFNSFLHLLKQIPFSDPSPVAHRELVIHAVDIARKAHRFQSLFYNSGFNQVTEIGKLHQPEGLPVTRSKILYFNANNIIFMNVDT